MPSFDVVSEINMHELNNAIDQTNREIETRYDFKNSNATVEFADDKIQLSAQNEFQVKQILDILYKKLAKRNIDIQYFAEDELIVSGTQARQNLNVRQGIDKTLAKKITQLIKESNIKVQSSIQGEQVRVTGKKKDDLQAAIALLRGADLGQPVQFNNFRD